LSARSIHSLGQSREGQLFQFLQFKSGRTVAKCSQQLFAPIEPQTTTVGEGLRGHVENGWHKPTFQLRRYFSKVAALSIVKCEQAERPFGTPGQAARQILQVDEVEPTAQHVEGTRISVFVRYVH